MRNIWRLRALILSSGTLLMLGLNAEASDRDLAYCQMLENNPIVQEYVSKSTKLLTLVQELNLNDSDRVAKALDFDTDDLLYRWIRNRLRDGGGPNAIRRLNYLTDLCLYHQRENKYRIIWFSGGSLSGNLLHRLIDRVNLLSQTQMELDSNGDLQKNAGEIDFSNVKVSHFTYNQETDGFYTPVLPHAIWLDGEQALRTVKELYFPKLDREIELLEAQANSVRKMMERRNRTWNASDP